MKRIIYTFFLFGLCLIILGLNALAAIQPPTTDETVTLMTKNEFQNSPALFSILPSVISSIGLKTNFPEYSSPVDIYLLLLTPDQKLLFLDSNNQFTEDLAPYAVWQTDPIVENIENISPASSGNYLGGWFIAPANGGNVIQSLNDGKFILGAYAVPVISLNNNPTEYLNAQELEIVKSEIGEIKDMNIETDENPSDKTEILKFEGENGASIVHKKLIKSNDTFPETDISTLITESAGIVKAQTNISSENHTLSINYSVDDPTIINNSVNFLMANKSAEIIVTKDGDTWYAEIPKNLISKWSESDVVVNMDGVSYEPEVVKDDPLIFWHFDGEDYYFDYQITVKWWDDLSDGEKGNDIGDYKLLNNAKVYLYDDDFLIGDDYLAEGVLENGTYTFKNIKGRTGGSYPDLYIKIKFNSNIMTFYSNIEIFTPTDKNITESKNVLFKLDKEEQSQYAFVFNLIHQLHDQIKVSTGYDIPKSTVHITADWTMINNSMQGLGLIIIDEPDVLNKFVISHEYGHFIMYKLYENDMPGSLADLLFSRKPDEHFICTESNNYFALNEGWADFMQNWFNPTDSLDWIQSDYNTTTFAGIAGCFDASNIEENEFWKGEEYYSICSNTSTNSKGEIIEGAVATVLWDIYDNDDTDELKTIKNGFNKTWKIISDDKPNDIIEFYSEYIENYPDDEESLCYIFKKNNISVDCEYSGGITDGLIAYYPFNGNAKDESGNGNDGSAHAANLAEDRFGNRNSAYQLTGGDSYVEIDSVASSISGVGAGTISIWVKAASTDSSGPMLWYDDEKYFPLGGFAGALPDSAIGIYTKSILMGANQNGLDYYFDDSWHHFILAIGNDFNRIYVDGSILSDVQYITGSSSTGNCMWGNISQVRIGERPSSSPSYPKLGPFDLQGTVDDLRIYNRALSESEVKKLYELEKPNDYSSKIVYSEDFENDPNWLSNDSENLYWDSSGYFYAHVQGNGTSYYAYSETFPTISNESFRLEVDIKPQTTAWGTYPHFILKDEDSNIATKSLWEVRFQIQYDDHSRDKFLLYIGENNVGGYSPQFDKNKWYHHIVVYDHSKQTVTWKVTEKGSDIIFHSGSKENLVLGDINQVVVGHKGEPPYYGNGKWATTLYDNIVISTMEIDENNDSILQSCYKILQSGNSIGDGVYSIDPDGDGGNDPVNVYCDMTTDGGGWTYLMNPYGVDLSQFSLDASTDLYTSSNNCKTESEDHDSEWYYSSTYVCHWDNSKVTVNWINVLNASEVMLRAVGNGNSSYVKVNGTSVVDHTNSKNNFATTSGTCGLNVCWREDRDKTFRKNATPVISSFSGDLKIEAGGTADGNKWGGSGSIWGVAVR